MKNTLVNLLIAGFMVLMVLSNIIEEIFVYVRENRRTPNGM